MPAEHRFPKSLVWAVVAICGLPPLLNLCGVSFGAANLPFDGRAYLLAPAGERDSFFYHALRGPFIHTLLEWTAFCVAVFTMTLSFMHFFLRRDIVTPIVGTALFFSGILDAFHTLAADLLTEDIVNRADFIPFTWTVSRMFNAVIVVVGAAPFLHPSKRRATGGLLRYMLLMGCLCGLIAYSVIHVCASRPHLPEPLSILPQYIHRPLDLLPLLLYLIAGTFVLPGLSRKDNSLFARGLQLSVLPHVMAQLYAMTSAQLYDNAFNVASGLKIVGYLVPMFGLLIEYTYAYHADAALRTAQEQLRVAREIQESLLPTKAPHVPGLDLAGCSRFAETVGGDYFDFQPRPDGTWMLVLADVSGHDPGASLLMANTRAYLRALVEFGASLGDSIARMNRFLCQDAEGRRFVTMFLVFIDPRSGRFSATAAGHPAYLISADAVTRLLEHTGIPLGCDENSVYVCSENHQLQPGETLLLATDGLLEAANPAQEAFGQDRVVALVRTLQDRPADEVAAGLLAAVKTFVAPAELTDDVTLIVAKLPPAAAVPGKPSPTAATTT